MKRFIVGAVLGFTLSLQAAVLQAQTPAEPDPAFKADIVRLLHAIGGEKVILGKAETLTDELIAPVKIVRTDVSDERFAQIKQEIMAFIAAELGGEESIFDVLIPIYASNYNHDEVKALADFYESPVGQKSLQVAPKIAEESDLAYQTWSYQFMPMIASQLQQRLQQ